MEVSEKSGEKAATASSLPATGSLQAGAPAFLDRVSVGLPGSWVTLREPDYTYQPQANTPASLLLLDRQYLAGTHEAYQRSVQRLETMHAVQHASQWRLTFDPATQHVVIHGLRIWRQGVVTEHAAPERFRLLQREENLERLMLDGSVTLVVLLDDVRAGDVLDASFTVHTTPRLFRENFSVFAAVPDAMPLGEFHLSVRFPAGRVMQWNSSDSGFIQEAREWEGESEWLWSIKNLEPATLEPGMPSWHLPTHWLQVSDCQSWGEVATELSAAWHEQADDAELARLTSEIAAATPDLKERAERTIALVQDEIRYLSMNIELGGQIPSPPGEVLRQRFGDCKDKSFLLAHLLRGFGIPARPVLVSMALRRDVGRLLPTAAAFDHCIVEYDIDGHRRWVDVTLPQQGGGALGRQVPDYGIGLPVSTETTGLAHVPADMPRDDRYTLRETFSPDTSGGTSVLKVIVTARGLSADQLRHSFVNEGADAVAQSREAFYRQLYRGLTRLGSILWRDDRAANEFTIAETFEIPDFVFAGQNPALRFFECHAHLLRSMLALPATLTRTYPLEFSLPDQIEHWIDVDFANQMTTEVPPASSRTEIFQFWRETKRTAVLFALRPLANVITPHQFAAHRTAVEKVFADTVLSFSLPAGLPVSRQARRPAALPGESSGFGSAFGGTKTKGLTPRLPRPTGADTTKAPSFQRLSPQGSGPNAMNRKAAPPFTPTTTAERPSPQHRRPEAPPPMWLDEQPGYRPPGHRRPKMKIIIGVIVIVTLLLLAGLVYLLLVH